LEITELEQYGITEKNNIALVSSRIIAEKFEKRHANTVTKENLHKNTEDLFYVKNA
jgi:phage regulator Rha-like protein